MTKPVELRIRAPWVPGGSFRLQLGAPASKKARAALVGQREGLRRLAVRGDWDVLQAVRAGTRTVEEVLAAVDRFGVDDYRAHLPAAPEPGPVVPTLDQHIAAWLDDCDRNPELRPSSVVKYRQHVPKLQDFVVDGARLGDRPWHEVPRHTIRDARASMDLAPNTIRTVLAIWSSFFQWAIDREESEAEHEGRAALLETNPVRRAKVWGKIETTRQRFLSPAEFSRLLDRAPLPMRAQYATLTLAGLRIAEFINLPPAHARLDDEVIHVGKWGDWRPKVDRSTRDVPIHEGLLPMLHAYREEFGGHDLAFFVNPATGRPWSYSAFLKRMGTDVRSAGMRYGAWTRESGDLERHADGVTPHTLRHTFGSWLAQRNVQLLTIAELMGDTYETVKDHYIHLLPGTLKDAVAALRVEGLAAA